MEVITKNARETNQLGQKIGSSLRGDTSAPFSARTIAFTGGLGAGKTTFIQGLAEGLGIKGKIISPTFILMRQYNNFYHLDLYRLVGDIKKEAENLGIFEILGSPKNIVAIEWAEKLKKAMPKNTIWIKFESIGENLRKITIK